MDRVRYTNVAITLHWAIALLVIVNLALGLFQDSLFPHTIPLHKSIGMTVLVLGVLRLVWRLFYRPPPLPASVRRWERAIAQSVHWLFYALIILLPLSGWVFTSASLKRYPLSFFGLFSLPMAPVTQDKALSHSIAERHEQLAWLMIALLALHIAAVIKHHFFDRDRVASRMIPGARIS